MTAVRQNDPPGRIRLGDLQEWHELWGICLFCQHRRRVDVRRLRRCHRITDALDWLLPMFTCTTCGVRGQATFEVRKPPR